MSVSSHSFIGLNAGKSSHPGKKTSGNENFCAANPTQPFRGNAPYIIGADTLQQAGRSELHMATTSLHPVSKALLSFYFSFDSAGSCVQWRAPVGSRGEMGCTPSKSNGIYTHQRICRDLDTCSTFVPSLKSSLSTPERPRLSVETSSGKQTFLSG